MTKCSLEMYLYNTLHLPVVVVVIIVVGNFLV